MTSFKDKKKNSGACNCVGVLGSEKRCKNQRYLTKTTHRGYVTSCKVFLRSQFHLIRNDDLLYPTDVIDDGEL